MGNHLRRAQLGRQPTAGDKSPHGHGTPAATDLARAPPKGQHRGLVNLTGENNCFLNVTIQALWHLDCFRSAIQCAEAAADIHEISIDDMITIVNSLFAQYEFSEGAAVPPTELRNRLVVIDSHKFSLGSLADATEALYSILSQIHRESCLHSCPPGLLSENSECSPRCVAHNIFGGVFVEQHTCSSCGASSEPQVMNRLLHYIYADEIISMVSALPGKPSFSSILSYCLRPVPHACPGSATLQQCVGEGRASLSCLEPPLVLALCVSWSSGSATKEHLAALLGGIDISLSVVDAFPYGNIADLRFHGFPTHTLCGVVCFYGKHYICFCKSSSS